VIPLITSRLLSSDARTRGWVLDGFPRTLAQAQALKAANLVPNRCVVMDVRDDVATERITVSTNTTSYSLSLSRNTHMHFWCTRNVNDTQPHHTPPLYDALIACKTGAVSSILNTWHQKRMSSSISAQPVQSPRIASVCFFSMTFDDTSPVLCCVVRLTDNIHQQ